MSEKMHKLHRNTKDTSMYRSSAILTLQVEVNIFDDLDIKRNQKVISQGIVNQTPEEDNNKKSQNLKLTKTEQLEKIYVKKAKMMKPHRKILKNEQMTKYPSESNCDGVENNKSKLENSAKVISVPAKSNNKFMLVMRGDRHACSTEKAIIDIDIHRRANSAKNKTGISKVYNITFKK